jgi:geranylgeranyl diphosphate synthase, type I
MAARKGSVRKRNPTPVPKAAAAASSNAFVSLLGHVRPDIEQRLTRYLDERVAASRALGPEVQALAGEVRRLAMLGGKRLRPALVVAGLRAVSVLARVDTDPRRLRGAFAAFAEMQLGAVAGQQLDMVGQGRDVELGYALKTGSYTVEGPLKLGALLAGAKPKTLEALSRYSRPAGVAFQLRDDLLSLFGDPKQTGKPLASDLISGKRTLLLRLALRRGKPAELALIRKVLKNPRAKAPALRAALGAIRATRAPELVEKRIQELSELALAELSRAVSPAGRELLKGATEALSLRRT